MSIKKKLNSAYIRYEFLASDKHRPMYLFSDGDNLIFSDESRMHKARRIYVNVPRVSNGEYDGDLLKEIEEQMQGIKRVTRTNNLSEYYLMRRLNK